MKVNIVGKNITVTPGISEKIQKKLNTLAKYFIIGEDDTANVLVRTYPTKQKIEYDNLYYCIIGSYRRIFFIWKLCRASV